MKNSSRTPNGFLCTYLLFHVLFPQLLSQGSADVTILQVEVTQVREAVAAVEVAHATPMFSAKTSAQEAAAAQDNANLRIKDDEDRAAQAERGTRAGVPSGGGEFYIALFCSCRLRGPCAENCPP
jgi:hypothetical protein